VRVEIYGAVFYCAIAWIHLSNQPSTLSNMLPSRETFLYQLADQ